MAETGPARNDVIAVVGGLALYVIFLVWLHPLLIGVPVLRIRQKVGPLRHFFALQKSPYICHKAPISISSSGSSTVPDEFASKRVTAPDIAERKGKAPVVALTAYHAHTARFSTPMST